MAPALLGLAVGFFNLLGCGGQTGGAPSGIVGALTNARIKVSSFSLTTSSAINDLAQVSRKTLEAVTTTPPTGVESVAGALYPTRNSKSFRVVLKGAGSNREDVSLYYNVFDRSNAIYDVANPESRASNDGLDTSLAKLYVAERPDAEQPGYKAGDPNLDTRPSLWPVEPVRNADGTFKTDASLNIVFRYSDRDYPKDPLAPVPSDRSVYRLQDAFLYTQADNLKAVRTGRRNVVVQFFSSTAAAARQHYTDVATISDPVLAAKSETQFLQDNLTNSYVFTVDIKPDQDVALTSAFQTNNGDNGLVESGDLTVVARGLPARWGSVKFEAYEENYGFGRPAIVFSKIVNLNDVQKAKDSSGEPILDSTFAQVVAADLPAPGYVSAKGGASYRASSNAQGLPDLGAGFVRNQNDPNRGGFPFANRQRVLKVYATCYELPDATGAVLAQTVEDGTYNIPEHPVMFIPTARAEAFKFFPNPGPGSGLPPPTALTETETRLADMQLKPAISDANVAARVARVAQNSTGETIQVTATNGQRYGRFAYDGTDRGNALAIVPSITLSNVGFAFSVVRTDVATPLPDPFGAYKLLPNVLADPDPPTSTTPGRLFWKVAPIPAKFSPREYPKDPDDTSKGFYKPAAFVQYRNYFVSGVSSFPAELVPNQGTTGVVIK